MMTMFRVESIRKMDTEENPNDGSRFSTTRVIEVGRPYDEPWRVAKHDPSSHYDEVKYVDNHTERDVVSIKSDVFGRFTSDDEVRRIVVELKDNTVITLPKEAFIIEYKESKFSY